MNILVKFEFGRIALETIRIACRNFGNKVESDDIQLYINTNTEINFDLGCIGIIHTAVVAVSCLLCCICLICKCCH